MKQLLLVAMLVAATSHAFLPQVRSAAARFGPARQCRWHEEQSIHSHSQRSMLCSAVVSLAGREQGALALPHPVLGAIAGG